MRTLKIDNLVIGGGAAGLFYAGLASARGRSVLVIDHAKKPAEKVRISGGGRCNFTNIHTAPHNFISENEHFAKSALARYTPAQFCDLMKKHGLSWTDKGLGQLFCDQKSGAVIDLLFDEMREGGATLRLQTSVTGIQHADNHFRVQTNEGLIEAERLIIATGGLSIPAIGASAFAYEVARQFGHRVITPRAGLVPFIFQGEEKERFSSISGVSTPVRAVAQGPAFDEALLFTHRGLSGPAMLQVSSYWYPGETVHIDLLAGKSLIDLKEEHPRKFLDTAIEMILPARLAAMLVAEGIVPTGLKLADTSNKRLEEIAAKLSDWVVRPTDTEGWRTAEVTIGGIDTKGLSSKTMESRTCPGLYFIGEAVDVTGWLGGYNFQWAWASAHAAATAD
ncbi:NAD(P)/FAD-dependent oxidoreductase [Parvularcula sp. LCG005]|uniref:NAD(P)/FAD-dependent oxidoreductase n=1 Tax=Parvularcula sp. LCG005 TaxID=3078805 RepID=UPI0029426338|nr:NAD(P)/FAD-dependent oxidoreductase [Parvularcula sp. LCG005]WOI52087.1 NAD(P)/FAD-dependent oxidoreductase [Parvularcula sp. LCG005]